jgi:hypothetical protein
MDTPSNITDSLDQTDEDFLNPTDSDDAIEAAAGIERVPECVWSFICRTSQD